MRGLSPGEGLVAAIKADTLSLISWQVACTASWPLLSSSYSRTSWGTGRRELVEFWAAMQVAMVAGCLTSYPVNWWLV